MPAPNTKPDLLTDNCICVYTHNVHDGVGDTMMMVKVAKELNNIKNEHKLPVVGIVYVENRSPCETVTKLLENNKELFKTIYILSEDKKFSKIRTDPKIHLIKYSKDEGKYQLDSEALIKKLGSCQLYIDIYNEECESTCGQDFLNYLNVNCPKKRIAEPGVQAPSNTPSDDLISLGLRDGIWIDEPKGNDITERAKNLLSIIDNSYKQVLTGKAEPTLEEAQQYLESHQFMPGYVQSSYQALYFIMSEILKNCDEQRRLIKNCDFHLPARTINHDLIQRAMNDLGLQDLPLSFLNPESPIALANNKSSIRIITGFFLEDEDYNTLHHISNDGAACSGDNSFSQVISSHHPAFITGYVGNRNAHDGNQFIRDFVFNEFFPYYLKSYLPKYVEVMSKVSELMGMAPNLRPGNNDYKRILDCIKETASVIKDPNFEKKWEECRQSMYDQQNFTKKFPQLVRNWLNLKPEQDNEERKSPRISRR